MDSSSLVHAFFHTNRRVRAPPARSGLVAHTGWWASSHDLRDFELRTTKRFTRAEFPFHAKFAGLQGWKYQWLLAETEPATSGGDNSARARAAPEPWLLMDTDVVVQCSGAELRERFARFQAQLVIGAEFNWWPKRDKLAIARGADPWPIVPPPFLRYPNSGLLAGTRAGFGALESAFKRSSPRYPCCPKMHNNTELIADRRTGKVACHIDDQHCLQSALLLGPRRGAPRVEYALDVNASLFLNLNGVRASQLVRGADGRCVYTETGGVPCVLHSNGKAAKPMMRHVFDCMRRDDVWVAPAGPNLSAAALFSTTH